MRVLFLANHFITLYSFRKELISKLLEDKHEVFLSLPEDKENKYFEDIGCRVIPTDIDRRGVNPIKDLKLIKQYSKIIKNIKPDIIFSYTIKPNIYGSLVSNKLKVKQVSNITGTGSTFIKPSFVSFICRILYKLSVRKSYKVFFQNSGDLKYFVDHKMVRNNYELLPGSGCNLKEYVFSPLPKTSRINFIFVGRVMKLKGIDEFLVAAKYIKRKYEQADFYVAGWCEEEKYKLILKEYEDQKIVKYLGFRNDISDVLKTMHCCVLPSHGGEGVPNVLLESSSIGRICIGSNINGTSDVIEDNVTGYLFETGNPNSLAEAIEKVILMSESERQSIAQKARTKIENEFDRNIVINKYLEELK